MAKNLTARQDAPRLAIKPVEILPMCGCTWKPISHTHNGRTTDEWNWDATHAIWERENKNPIPSRKLTYAKYKYAHLVPQ